MLLYSCLPDKHMRVEMYIVWYNSGAYLYFYQAEVERVSQGRVIAEDGPFSDEGFSDVHHRKLLFSASQWDIERPHHLHLHNTNNRVTRNIY